MMLVVWYPSRYDLRCCQNVKAPTVNHGHMFSDDLTLYGSYHIFISGVDYNEIVLDNVCQIRACVEMLP